MYARRQAKNPAAEAEQFRRRAALSFVLAALGTVGLAAWYFKLQVLEHAEYATRSEANRIKARPVVPGRGMIYDRQGRLLAENLPAYRLDVLPEKAGDPERLIERLGRLIELDPEDVERFHVARRATRGFRPVTLKLRLSDEEMARFSVDRWRFPGVELEPYLTRHYPYGDLFAHIVGYVGRVDEKDLETLGENNAVLTHIGKTGLERYYETELRGRIGYERVETNVDGRALRTVGRVPAVPGADLRLSVDAELQRAIVEAFGEQEGTAVAVDPRNGEILAMVSLPSYDTNLFVNGISSADYRRLMDNPSRPLFNRVVLGGVAPGSTLKPLLALAGLDSGLRRPEDRVLSTGAFRIGGRGREFRDSAAGGHGWTDLRRSIYASVNTYYYQLSLDMGIARIDEHMQRYGFGAPTGIDLTGEIGGVLPSPQWKAAHARDHGPWTAGDTVLTSIGQGFWVVTPLQLVQAVAALADEGRLHRPHLARARRDGFDADWEPLPQPRARDIVSDRRHLQPVREGMIETVHGAGGTARSIGVGIDYLIAGKTGTAQVVGRRGGASLDPRSLPLHLRHRALFVGFAPADAPTIAVAVVVEGGGYGGRAAAPIARRIFDVWLRPAAVAGDEAPAEAPAEAPPEVPAAAPPVPAP